jgi:hypothetical protein
MWLTSEAGVLVITADDRFYYSLFSVCLDMDWNIRRARSAGRAHEELRSRPVPVVVYDERLPWGDWREDLRSVSSLAERPAVVLAAARVEEDVWKAVLRCEGYDLIRRSAPCGEWRRMLQFAWLSRHHNHVPGRAIFL